MNSFSISRKGMFFENKFFYCYVLLNVLTLCQADTLVNTPSGPIQGVKTVYNNEVVYEFRKIPYAKSPIGELRFRKPERLEKWTDTLNATEYGPSCMQTFIQMQAGYTDIHYIPNMSMSEDCLFLNIFVPRNITEKNNMAVMIYIHGGSYYIGQGMRYDGTYLALNGDVIVVTINYRLGIFGFLSTGDSASPGNYGIWDQRLAIQWVKENIAVFGGNPSSITIFGQSAGGFSVSLHSLIPLNKGLFQRIIPQSGVSNSLLAVTETKIVKQYAILVANQSGCLNTSLSDNSVLKFGDSVNTTLLIECLRQVNAELLNKYFLHAYALNYATSTDITLGMTPVIDGELLTDYPYNLISNKSSEAYAFFRSLDMITGTTDGEGSILLNFLKGQRYQQHLNLTTLLSSKGLCSVVAPVMTEQLYANISDVSEAMCNAYQLDSNTTSWTTQASQGLNMYADALFVSPDVRSLQIHSSGNTESTSFQYLFTTASLSAIGGLPPLWYDVAPHGSELLYLFLDKFVPLSQKRDKNLRRIMVTYWTNFAKTGNPNSKGVPLWPPYMPGHTYQHLNVNNITTEKNLYCKRMKFWLQDVPDIIHQQNQGTTNNGPRLIYMDSVIQLISLILFMNYIS